jgi:hypothetical protein
MASASYQYVQSDQPGLEVFYQSGLEVLQYDHWPQVVSGLQELSTNQHGYPVQCYDEHKATPTPQAAMVVEESKPPPRRWTPTRIILAVLIGVVIFTTIIIGAVVGTIKSRGSSHSSPTAISPPK